MSAVQEPILPLPQFEYLMPAPTRDHNREWASARRLCHGRAVVDKHAVDQWCHRVPKSRRAKGRTATIRRRLVDAAVRGKVWRMKAEGDKARNVRFDVHDRDSGMVVRVVTDKDAGVLRIVTAFVYEPVPFAA